MGDTALGNMHWQLSSFTENPTHDFAPYSKSCLGPNCVENRY